MNSKKNSRGIFHTSYTILLDASCPDGFYSLPKTEPPSGPQIVPLDREKEKRNNPLPDNRSLRRASKTETGIQHTLGHVRCPACLQAAARLMRIDLSPELSFRDAAPIWLASRKGLSPGTIHDYEKNILRLNEFFGDMPLREITIGNIAAYQEQRQTSAGASRINHETMTLGQILDRAKLWATLKENFEPLPLPKKKRGKALNDTEEARLFEIAAARPKCRIGFCVWLITANTTAHWSEVVNLRLRHISLTPTKDEPFGVIHVEDGVKNQGRVRDLAMTETTRKAVDFLMSRARKCGAYQPDHFLIPDRFGNPDKPMTSCKTAWYSVRNALVLEFPHLAGLRQYDLRHHSITRLLENPDVSEATAEGVAGWISMEMKKTYSHPRKKAKAEALASIETKVRLPF